MAKRIAVKKKTPTNTNNPGMGRKHALLA